MRLTSKRRESVINRAVDVTQVTATGQDAARGFTEYRRDLVSARRFRRSIRSREPCNPAGGGEAVGANNVDKFFSAVPDEVYEAALRALTTLGVELLHVDERSARCRSKPRRRPSAT